MKKIAALPKLYKNFSLKPSKAADEKEEITLYNIRIVIDPEPRGSLADYLKTYST